ncbi:Protein tyrosine phosphatase type IVA 1 [Nowakowskiella sp. JEL0407]|nr:Protein tyrosine phosphatase type IVA 1 [Nowakowskiella sp. JEL0407]
MNPNVHSSYSQMWSIVAHPDSPFQFVILDCPSDDTLPDYIPILRQYNVTHLLRLTEKSMYDPTPLIQELNIAVHDNFSFEDGSVPSEELIEQYRALLDSLTLSDPTHTESKTTIAIHCISGIGRAPVLVAISLIDAGIDSLDAVEYVRKQRRGAFNKKQLLWLTDQKVGFKKRKNKKALFGGLFKNDSSVSVGSRDSISSQKSGIFGKFNKSKK